MEGLLLSYVLQTFIIIKIWFIAEKTIENTLNFQ